MSQARRRAAICGFVRPLIASAKKSSVVSVRRYCCRNASSFRRTSASSGWALGCALHGRQNIRLALKSIDDARQMAPQRDSQISLKMAPGFGRRQVIELETRSRERPMRDLSLGLITDSLDLVNHIYAPGRLRRERWADYLCRSFRQYCCLKAPFRPAPDRVPSVPAGARS